MVLDLYAAPGGKTSYYIWERRWSALAFSDSLTLLREQLEDFRFALTGLQLERARITSKNLARESIRNC